jgi:hypothetical protein
MRDGTRWSHVIAVAAATALVGLHLTTATAAADETVDIDLFVLGGTATATPPVQLLGGGGTFTYSSNVTGVGNVCAVASLGAPATGETEGPIPGVLDAEVATSCSATAGGTYANLVCGTGTAGGSTGSLVEGSGSDTYALVGFSVSFFAGVGVLFGAASESEPDAGPNNQGTVAGLVVIAPAPPVQSPPACALNLAVVAVLFTNA